MPETKTMIRFFTIADYEEEEIWLHEQHKNGWKLHKMIPPCLYIFEKCTPEDVIYRLDYKNGAENANYFQLFTDYGWSTSAAASDGCISASPHPFKTPSRTASCFPITNRKLTSFAIS